jgi:2,5-dioxopentanoate dehydrogenase
MGLHGSNYIGTQLSSVGQRTFFGFDPREGKRFDTPFQETTEEEIDRSLELAARGFPMFRGSTPAVVAGFLERIAREIAQLGDQLIDQAGSESGLRREWLIGEPMINQLRFLADLAPKGSFVGACVDPALPGRKAVASVFGASNFPPAFSVAGDTASAFAATNPVVA